MGWSRCVSSVVLSPTVWSFAHLPLGISDRNTVLPRAQHDEKRTGHRLRTPLVCAPYQQIPSLHNLWKTTHKTRDRESSRLVNKEESYPWKVPTSEWDSISGPFPPGEIATALNRQEPGKFSDVDSNFSELLHAEPALNPACAISSLPAVIHLNSNIFAQCPPQFWAGYATAGVVFLDRIAAWDSMASRPHLQVTAIAVWQAHGPHEAERPSWMIRPKVCLNCWPGNRGSD